MTDASARTSRMLVLSVELVVENEGSMVAEDPGRDYDRALPLDVLRGLDGGGSEVGLAMVEEVVAARGGTLDVSTSPSGAARFVVRLPVPATVAAAV